MDLKSMHIGYPYNLTAVDRIYGNWRVCFIQLGRIQSQKAKFAIEERTSNGAIDHTVFWSCGSRNMEGGYPQPYHSYIDRVLTTYKFMEIESVPAMSTY